MARTRLSRSWYSASIFGTSDASSLSVNGLSMALSFRTSVAHERLLSAARVEDDVEAHGSPQLALGAVGRRHRAPQAVEQVVERAVENGEEDLLLGVEVVVQARRLQAELARQRAHRGAVIAALTEEGRRRAEDPIGGDGVALRGDGGEGSHTY